jgi:hypothetical protein
MKRKNKTVKGMKADVNNDEKIRNYESKREKYRMKQKQKN